MKPLLVALVGPTAGGKSAVGVELARRIGGEIISCDSMQVYRGMPICTQASKKIVRGVRHHLVSFLEPTREYSAAQFRKDAETAVAGILRRKRVPIFVGGTGLYLRALLDGLFENEHAGQDDALRKRLYQEAETSGAAVLHERLSRVDAGSAAKIHPNDLRRVVRALEVYEKTGRPMSALKPKRAGLREAYDCRVFLIDLPREILYRRIEKRVDRMMRAGLLKEVQALRRKKLSRTASMALGVREMQAVLAKEMTRKDAVELLKKNTRHYAKRQLSWFRHERGVERVEAGEQDTAQDLAQRIEATLAS